MSLGPPVVNEIDSFVNPNEAAAASLVRLPGIGISKAAAIVSYREDFARAKTGGRAFGDVDELENVAGIGPKTAARLAEYLIFE